jgi:hypothetical protein
MMLLYRKGGKLNFIRKNEVNFCKAIEMSKSDDNLKNKNKKKKIETRKLFDWAKK